MDDLISREDAINAIYHHFPNVSMERATEILHECQSAEIIRCKDCKHYDGYYCLNKRYGYGFYTPPRKLSKGFCDWAERREE